MNCKQFGVLTGEKWDSSFEKSRRIYNSLGNSPTIDTMAGGGREIKVAIMDDKQAYRIRKLTPKECWRLMGFDDSDFEKAERVCSNTQLYKQAGNSIVVNVLEHILVNLLPQETRSQWLDDLLGGD